MEAHGKYIKEDLELAFTKLGKQIKKISCANELREQRILAKAKELLKEVKKLNNK